DHVLEQGRILAQTGPVTDALRAAALQRLVDRRRPVALARVTGAGKAVLHRQGEGGAVVLRWMAVLGASEIEAHDARAPVPHRHLRKLERHRRGECPDAAHNQPDPGARFSDRALDATERRLDRLCEGPGWTVEQRR